MDLWIFGQNVFSLREMSNRLPKPVYSTFIRQIQGNEIIDKTTADAIAHAVKVWPWNVVLPILLTGSNLKPTPRRRNTIPFWR